MAQKKKHDPTKDNTRTGYRAALRAGKEPTPEQRAANNKKSTEWRRSWGKKK